MDIRGFNIVVVAALVLGAGCGGDRCVGDACDTGGTADSVVVPDDSAPDDTFAVIDADGGAVDAALHDAPGDTIADAPADDIDGDVACGGYTPHMWDGQCVECRDSDDCGDGTECCDPDWHVCLALVCGTGTIFSPDVCDCRQCFTNDDCERFGDRGTGICLDDGTCDGIVPCDGLCTPDFPVCAIVGGVEVCVQCASDDDCVELGYEGCSCVGDPLYSCIDDSGAACQGETPACGPCRYSEDCPAGPSGQALECIQIPDWGSGTCIDPAGSCDGIVACCHRGQTCSDLALVMQEIVPTVPRLIPQPTVTLAFCGCDTAWDCLTGDPCTDLSILCTSGDYPMEGMYDLICPDGQLHQAFPVRLCVQPATLLEYFGLTPVQ